MAKFGPTTTAEEVVRNVDLRGKHKSVAQGAAASVWAAAYPGIEAFGGAYLEDCSAAPPVEQVNPTYGVMPYARDPVLADKT